MALAVGDHRSPQQRTRGGGHFVKQQFNTGVGRIVPVQAHRAIQVVDEQVRVAVIVKISDGRTVAAAHRIQAPGGSCRLELERIRLPKRPIAHPSVGHGIRHFQITRPGLHPLGAGKFEVVQIVRPPLDTISDEYIRAPIQVEIFQQHRPAPIGSGQPRKFGHLPKKGLIGVQGNRCIQLHVVAWILVVVSIIELELVDIVGIHIGSGLAQRFRLGPHIQRHQVSVAIPVNISRIHPHTKLTRRAGVPVDRLPERTVAIV